MGVFVNVAWELWKQINSLLPEHWPNLYFLDSVMFVPNSVSKSFSNDSVECHAKEEHGLSH